MDELEKTVEDTKTAYDEWEYLNDCGDDWTSVHRSLKVALDALQTVKQNRWIPVSEKLAKYSDSVLVSLFDHEIDIASYYCDTWHINGCGSVEDGAVLAWMHLPKPYEGDKE